MFASLFLLFLFDFSLPYLLLEFSSYYHFSLKYLLGMNMKVVKMEADILKTLNFEMGNPTIKTFLR